MGTQVPSPSVTRSGEGMGGDSQQPPILDRPTRDRFTGEELTAELERHGLRVGGRRRTLYFAASS